ncbi:biotin protein ligase C terminal domain-containing protein [Thermococcus litoralis DSM 5473]|uniref:Biotin protein ligase C terminal domain-containing protein n=1 Tax=Thermococcus litoralis (strain ATCC 51850 / DSM 5473 / JCM 8560 / NS-C) TaxID=523849 RepID=H3ZRG2_THELN|nr:hypothetical protein [Thermococcus litoralis]EHR77490.1 biotin protein ligase C terminal domain-containing protein [Thermococcus litoralis DSM 5473]
MKRKIVGGVLVVFVLLAMIVFHQTKAEESHTALALYDSAKIGVVEKTIQVELKKGINEVPLEMLKGLQIDEVTLKPLDEKVKVLGVVGKELKGKDLVEANIGKEITIKLKSGETLSGKFLGYKDGKIAIQGDGYYLISQEEIAYIKMASIGEESTADVYAIVNAEEDGKYFFKLIYRVGGIGWSSRYKLYLGDKAEFYGYVVIDNPTNKSFENTDVLLVSGDVQFYQPPQIIMDRYYTLEAATKEVPQQPIQRIKLEAFYLYKLGTIDIEAFEKKLIPYIYQESKFTREYLYESYPYGGSQDVYEIISLETSEVLPRGVVEIYKEMEDKNVLIGEQMIDHTAKGDILRLKLGRDVDLKGKTEVLEEKHRERYSYYKIKVTVENFGKESREVIVRHYKWRGKILESSVSPIVETANYVEFKITVNPGEKEEIIFDYEVTY